MAPTRSLGQAASRSKASSVMPDVNASLIIRRHTHRAITGCALDITVHQHQGYRVHYEWNGAFGNRCFERRFPSYNSLSQFCITLINWTPGDLCSCLFSSGNPWVQGIGARARIRSDILQDGVLWAGGAPFHPAMAGRAVVDDPGRKAVTGTGAH